MTAKEIHNSAIIVDTHADTTQRLLDENFDMANPPAGDYGHVDFAKAAAGNLGAEFFSIWVEPEKFKGHYARRTLDLIDSVYEQAARNPSRMMIAYSVADIRRARAGPHKRLAALMGIEGGHSIENDIHLLRDYYRLGVRYMTLTWSNTNEWGDSSGDIDNPNVAHHDGLTEFGKDVVREMNRLGMMVDISHVADKTFFDAISVTQAPVIASHSSARALTNHPRNMTDEMLRAVTKNGGVVMVNFFSAFVDENFRKAWDAQAPERNRAVEEAVNAWKQQHPGGEPPYNIDEKVQHEWGMKIPRPPLSSLIDHIDHIAKVAGMDHVGLGSDFDGVSYLTPEGIDSAADLPKISQALAARGYSANDIHKILGGNLLRVLSQVEATAHRLQARQVRDGHAEAGTSPASVRRHAAGGQ
ncbi:MAG: dipeptidase [Acidobacteria bacterium]|nr:dipeptidase [Acidobacteriota bacterium]